MRSMTLFGVPAVVSNPIHWIASNPGKPCSATVGRSGSCASRLTRVFGAHRLDLVEDAVQYALVQALQHWPYQGVPDNAHAWLTRVASNRALDVVRADRKLRSLDADETAGLQEEVDALTGPLIGLPWEQENPLPRGEVRLEYNSAFVMELSTEAEVPEWGGQRLVLATEEPVLFTREGCGTLCARQTEFHVI